MERDQIANARMQNGMRDARTHVNRQKQRDDIEPPRTVGEQRAELETVDADGHRRRDPVKAAELQHQRRDNGVGGAILDVSQRVNSSHDDVEYEKQPDRHAARADARARERDTE